MGRLHYALHDTHFNVIGLVDASGGLVERYDYSPYGQRTVYTSPGTNDPDCHAPILISKRQTISSVNQPWGLCSVGFQGLMHDEETGNVQNRARVWSPTLGRFHQRDPLGYPDGLNAYAGYHVLAGGLDPTGLAFWNPFSWTQEEWKHNALRALAVPLGGAPMGIAVESGLIGPGTKSSPDGCDSCDDMPTNGLANRHRQVARANKNIEKTGLDSNKDAQLESLRKAMEAERLGVNAAAVNVFLNQTTQGAAEEAGVGIATTLFTGGVAIIGRGAVRFGRYVKSHFKHADNLALANRLKTTQRNADDLAEALRTLDPRNMCPKVMGIDRPNWANSPGGFVNWLRTLQSKGGSLTGAEADAIIAESQRLGIYVRLDPPHFGTNWNVPHLNIGSANVHLQVPAGYSHPTVATGTVTTPN